MAWKVTCHLFYLLPHFLGKQNEFKIGNKYTAIFLGDHDLSNLLSSERVCQLPSWVFYDVIIDDDTGCAYYQ